MPSDASLPAVPPFVGRDAELQTLRAALDAAQAGCARCVRVTGPPGIGKTRLVEELVAALPADRVLWGRCHDAAVVPAYWPWRQALRAHVARQAPEALGREAADLTPLLPELRERLPEVPDPPAIDPEQARVRLFDAVAGLLRRGSTDEALVVVLDDLHWADSETLLLLAFVAEELRDSRLLLLGTYRDAEVQRATAMPRLPEDLARVSEHLALSGLGEEHVSHLIAVTTGTIPPASLAATVQRATEGNPFFVAEVVELLRSEGRLDADTAVGAAGFRMPDSVRAAIRRRLDPLPARTRRALPAAAVLGAQLDVATLAATLDSSVDATVEALRPAVVADLMTAIPQRVGRYRFAHALVQATLVDDLAPGERGELHRRAGEALERLHAADPAPPLAELAHHFFEGASAAGPAKAIDYAVRAGRRAMGALGFEEAARHFERALRVEHTAGGEAGRRLGLLLEFGEAERRSGDEDGARATFLEAAQLARGLGDAGRLGRAAIEYAITSAETGIVDRTAVTLLEEALAALGSGDSPERAFALGMLSRALYFAPDAAARRDALSRESVAVARRLGDADALRAALTVRHFVLWRPGTAAERLALVDEVLALGEGAGAGSIEIGGEAHSWRLLDLLELGDVDEADRELERFARMSEETRLPHYRWGVVLARGARALFEGRLEEAEALAHQALAIRQPTSRNNALQFFAAQLFYLRKAQGRLHEIALLVAQWTSNTDTHPIWRCAGALLEATLGRQEAARHLLDVLAPDDFAALSDDAVRLPGLAALAEVAALAGAPAHAAAIHRLLLPHARLNLVNGIVAALPGPVTLFLGMTALAAGQVEAAVGHLEAAIAAATQMRGWLHVAGGQAWLADALDARRSPADQARATALRTEARATAERLGLGGVLARLGEGIAR